MTANAEATGAREALLLRMTALIADLALDTWNRKDARTVDAMDVLHTLRELPTPSPAASPDASVTPAPSPTLKHRYVDRPPLVIDEGDTPSASPEASQSPSRAAQDTADGRVFVGWQWQDGQRVWSEVRDGICSWTPQDWDEHHPQHAPHLVLVPRSELARVQRERDAARASRDDWERIAWERAKNIVKAQQQLDTALDRARVAEQRIETGVVCWRDEQGCYWQQEPNDLGRRRHGPFTRGRFVADQEGA